MPNMGKCTYTVNSVWLLCCVNANMLALIPEGSDVQQTLYVIKA